MQGLLQAQKSPHIAGLVCKMWAIRDGGTAGIGLA